MNDHIEKAIDDKLFDFLEFLGIENPRMTHHVDVTSLTHSVISIIADPDEIDEKNNEIEELSSEIEELTDECDEKNDEIDELQEQIEKMKCCYNCKHSKFNLNNELECSLGFHGYDDDNNPICFKHDKWEMVE